MKITDTGGAEVRGCATFRVGQVIVSVSCTFPVGSTAVIDPRGEFLKMWDNNDAQTVVKAIRWAQRREKARG